MLSQYAESVLMTARRAFEMQRERHFEVSAAADEDDGRLHSRKRVQRRYAYARRALRRAPLAPAAATEKMRRHMITAWRDRGLERRELVGLTPA